MSGKMSVDERDSFGGYRVSKRPKCDFCDNPAKYHGYVPPDGWCYFCNANHEIIVGLITPIEVIDASAREE